MFQAALTAFKGAHFGEKNFLSCDIRIDPEADSMKVEMQLVHGVLICHILMYAVGSIPYKHRKFA